MLDVRADLDNGEVCDIEVQVATQSNIEKRMLFYWSKLYYSGIQLGENYKKLNKTIVILIANFEIKSIKDIPKYHTKWKIREEDYSKVILTEVLEIHIIDLLKLTKQLEKGIIKGDDKVALWARFIINPEMLGEEVMSENKDIKKANEVLEEIQEDKREQYLAHLRLKYILDKNESEEYGYERGQKEIVINMYKEKLSIEDIVKFTKISKEEVEEIIKESEEDDI